MNKPKDWESEIIFMQQQTGKEFFLCDPERNQECRKTNCHIIGGECFLTINKKYAKEEET